MVHFYGPVAAQIREKVTGAALTGVQPPSATPSSGILHLHQVPNITAQLGACHRDPSGSRCNSSASPHH
jgi:hypothetical protein